MRIVFLYFCTLFMLSSPSIFTEAFEQTPEFLQIEQLLDQAEYTAARNRIQKILKDPHWSQKEKALLYWYEGICYISSADTLQAKKSFRQLLSYDPDFQLEDSLSPKIKEIFSQAKEELDIGQKHQIALITPSIVEKPKSSSITWPYWLSAGVSVAAGIILTCVLLSTSREGDLSVVVHPQM